MSGKAMPSLIQSDVYAAPDIEDQLFDAGLHQRCWDRVGRETGRECQYPGARPERPQAAHRATGQNRWHRQPPSPRPTVVGSRPSRRRNVWVQANEACEMVAELRTARSRILAQRIRQR